MATVIAEEISRGGGLSDEAAELAARVQASVVLVRSARSGSGSGVIWNDAGLVVTNHHVVPLGSAEVVLGSRTRLPAKVVRRDERLDLAALEVDGELHGDGVRAATIGDSARLRPGELVIAVGNPLGERNVVTMGVVSGFGALSGFGGQWEVLRAAVTLRPGNSGGALADMHGRVVGVPNMVVGPGLALAVPSQAVEQFLLGESPGRAVLGLVGRWVGLPDTLVWQHRLPARMGLMLEDVRGGSPAERAGLTLGDIVVAVASEGASGGPMDVLSGLSRLRVGVPTRLAALRGGALHWFVATPTTEE